MLVSMTSMECCEAFQKISGRKLKLTLAGGLGAGKLKNSWKKVSINLKKY